MPNVREIKSRIKSVTETRQITKAMKLISAAKMRKARMQLEKALPYFNKVKETMADILLHSGNMESFFFNPDRPAGERKKGYLVLCGDKTLAGGYNHNIIKAAEDVIDYRKDSLFVAGAVGLHHFIKKGYKVDRNFEYPVQNPSVYRAREMADMLIDKFKSGELDEIYIIFTLLETSIAMKPVVMKLLPLELESLKSELKMDKDLKPREGLVYEPSPAEVFDLLIPKYVKGIVYGALTEAFASEQSARMTAMDNATSNADEMLHNLNLSYNRARQAAITQEISEIIGGAEALK